MKDTIERNEDLFIAQNRLTRLFLTLNPLSQPRRDMVKYILEHMRSDGSMLAGWQNQYGRETHTIRQTASLRKLTTLGKLRRYFTTVDENRHTK